MPLNILVFYGSYRTDRRGIRLAHYLLDRLRRRGNEVTLIDAKAIGLPMLDRMYKEYDKGTAPAAMESLAAGFGRRCIRVRRRRIQLGRPTGPQEFDRSLSGRMVLEAGCRGILLRGGRLSGVRSATTWHGILSEMGMIVTSSGLSVGPITETWDESGQPTGPRKSLEHAFANFADDLAWWANAARAQRAAQPPPY